ncbi:alpha/beta fold hydrolase [Chloroflexota bacterium]
MKNLRKYGKSPYTVAVIHGGPGAPGEMAAVARELSLLTGILEPLQTKSTLEEQVEELKEVLEESSNIPIILIGHSWGAWLAYILTARYPALVKKLILIASGAFEEKYAVSIMTNRLSRLSEDEREEVLNLMVKFENPGDEDMDKLFSRFGEFMIKTDSFSLLPVDNVDKEVLKTDYDINQTVWKQAHEMRISGELLEMGKKIECPVLAIHGDYDPHLAEGVEAPLSRVIKDLKFVLLPKCGHYPWKERHARDAFYDILKQEVR